MPDTVQNIVKDEMFKGDSVGVCFLTAIITEFPKRWLVTVQASVGLAHKKYSFNNTTKKVL